MPELQETREDIEAAKDRQRAAKIKAENHKRLVANIKQLRTTALIVCALLTVLLGLLAGTSLAIWLFEGKMWWWLGAYAGTLVFAIIHACRRQEAGSWAWIADA